MELKIISWESKGLRCPDGKVNLRENGYKRFNFIQMPNGTGKTTYLELIQYALSGYLRFLDGPEIGKYFHVAKVRRRTWQRYISLPRLLFFPAWVIIASLHRLQQCCLSKFLP